MHQWLFSGGIRTKIGACSYFVTFEYECLSAFLIWGGTKKIIAIQGGETPLEVARKKGHMAVVEILLMAWSDA
jgi:hypothetical protein